MIDPGVTGLDPALLEQILGATPNDQLGDAIQKARFAQQQSAAPISSGAAVPVQTSPIPPAAPPMTGGGTPIVNKGIQPQGSSPMMGPPSSKPPSPMNLTGGALPVPDMKPPMPSPNPNMMPANRPRPSASNLPQGNPNAILAALKARFGANRQSLVPNGGGATY